MLAANPGGGNLYAPPPSAAGAASPSASPSPYYAPPSGAVGAAQDYAGATDAYKRALIRYNQQRTGLLKQYGYAGDINADNGMVQNLRVDGSNTHGALQTLLGQQADEDVNAQYAAEDRGLHGGLAHQSETRLHSAHSGQTSALGQSLFGGLSDLDSQQLDAHSVLDQALWQLTHQATTDSIDNGDYNPATTEDPPPEAPSAPPTAKKPTAKPKTAPAKPIARRNTSGAGNSRAAVVAKKVIANAYTNGSKKRG